MMATPTILSSILRRSHWQETLWPVVWGLNSWLGRGWNAGVGSGAFWKISVAYMVSLLVSSKFFLLLLPCGEKLTNGP